MPKPEITSYTVVDLLSWQESGGLRISPKFQRRSVWTNPAKGFFIDSILQDYPIPPIHIRLTHEGGRKPVREVIDGQQRIRAIFDFIAGDFRIPASVSPGWGGKSYKSLSDEDRDSVNLFSFTVYQYKRLSDADVLDIFSRLNTYSVSLNAQELRNGKWFGHYKQTSYRLATGSIEFWRRHKIFNEQQIARMREVELTSELLATQLDGMQDKKSSLDTFYEHLDEAWGGKEVKWATGRTTPATHPLRYLSGKESEHRFLVTIKAIDDALGDVLQKTPLRRPALFYTLYCATYHIIYGLPQSEDLPLAGAGMTETVNDALRQVAGELTSVFADKGRSQVLELQTFYEGAARQTDNIGPRSARLESLLAMIQSTL